MHLVTRATNRLEFLIDRQRFRDRQSDDRVREVCERRYGYRPAEDPFAEAMGLIAADEPAIQEFDDEWRALAAELDHIGSGLDSDRLTAAITYCTIRHVQPEIVVETGVARGISSRLILAAMERNSHGCLVSIDLYDGPDARVAVPEGLRHRWTFLPGTGRRLLPGVLAEHRPGVFIHDSQHTYRNMRFELGRGWAALKPGGVLISDDIHENAAFAELLAATDAPAVIGQADVKAGFVGFAVKPR